MSDNVIEDTICSPYLGFDPKDLKINRITVWVNDKNGTDYGVSYYSKYPKSEDLSFIIRLIRLEIEKAFQIKEMNVDDRFFKGKMEG